jgi:putative hydrolase of the HAD superfamily
MAIQPKALIFDYGNVLCAPQESSDLARMAEILNLTEAEFYPIYWSYRLPYDESKLDTQSYWHTVASDARRAVTDEQIERLSRLDVESWSRPSPVMVAWARALHEAGLATAILSNMPMDLRTYLISSVTWLPAFNHMTFSCDVRMVKPMPGIYECCLQGLGVTGPDVLFLDDRPENIEAAQRLGMHAVLFTTPEEASAALDGTYLLPVAIGG